MAEDDAAALPPRAFRELRDLIVTNRSKLPKRLAQVAAYAIDYPDDMAFGTVARIAEAAEVQPSTLIRFAKALGYDGFSDLQAVFQERLRNRPARAMPPPAFNGAGQSLAAAAMLLRTMPEPSTTEG